MHLKLLLPSQDGCFWHFHLCTCETCKLVHLWNTAGHLSPHGEVCVKTRGARKINKIVTSFCPASPDSLLVRSKQKTSKFLSAMFWKHIYCLLSEEMMWRRKTVALFSGACVSLDSLACWDFLKDEHLDERTIGSPLLFKHTHHIYDLVPEYTPLLLFFLQIFLLFNI